MLVRESGLLDDDEPNLTRYLFTDPRARTLFLDWDQVADEQAFHLWLAPSAETSEWFKVELAPHAGPEFTRRLGQHIPLPTVPLRIKHPIAGELRWQRETLNLTAADAQQIVIFLPDDQPTAQAMDRLQAGNPTKPAGRELSKRRPPGPKSCKPMIRACPVRDPAAARP